MEPMNDPDSTVTDLDLYRVQKELATKNPAAVARVYPSRRVQSGQIEIMGGPDRWAVVGAMQKAELRGEIQIIRRNPRWNARSGRYEVIVRRLKNPRPAWVKPTAVAGASLASLAILFGIGMWVMLMLGSAPMAWLGMAVVAVLLALILRGVSGGRGRHGAVDVDVSVRVRNR